MSLYINLLWWGVVRTSPNPQGRGPPIVDCPPLRVQHSQLSSVSRMCLLHLQPDGVPRSGDRTHTSISTPFENWTHVYMNLFTRNSPYYHLLKYLLFLLKHPLYICVCMYVCMYMRARVFVCVCVCVCVCVIQTIM
jgi:hypothetical protein